MCSKSENLYKVLEKFKLNKFTSTHVQIEKFCQWNNLKVVPHDLDPSLTS